MLVRTYHIIQVMQISCIRGILLTTTTGQFVIQNHYFTYQRKGNHELQIQALNVIVAGLQNQINNLSGGGSSSGGCEIGVS